MIIVFINLMIKGIPKLRIPLNMIIVLMKSIINSIPMISNATKYDYLFYEFNDR